MTSLVAAWRMPYDASAKTVHSSAEHTTNAS